jgi:hypothetical protein
LYPLLSLRSSTSTVHDKGWPEPFFFTVHIRYFFVSLACHVLLINDIADSVLHFDVKKVAMFPYCD